jgi:hypothetical protein
MRYSGRTTTRGRSSPRRLLPIVQRAAGLFQQERLGRDAAKTIFDQQQTPEQGAEAQAKIPPFRGGQGGRTFQGSQALSLSALRGLRGERLFRNGALHANRCALVARTGDFP